MKRILSLCLLALAFFQALIAQEPALTAAGGSWELVWSDEFSTPGLPDPAWWSFETRGNAYGWGNGEDQFYTDGTPDNAFIENGILTIRAREEEMGGKKYTSARINTKGKAYWRYGRFEARMKLPSGRGIWPAFWMMSEGDTYGYWPRSGEIDIMEFFGFIPNETHANIHTEKYNHKIGTNKGARHRSDFLHNQFNIYAVEWYPDRLDFFFNEVKIFTFRKERAKSDVWPFDKPFYIILNNAVGGDWGRKNGGIGDTPFPQDFQIDYVRVYKNIPDKPVRLTVQAGEGGTIVRETAGEQNYTGELNISGVHNLSGEHTFELSGGQTITLRAQADSGFRFSGWSGDHISEDSVFTSRIFENSRLTANFTQENNLLDNGDFTRGLGGWNTWVDVDNAQARFTADKGNLEVVIEKPGKQDWQIQLSSPVTLTPGKTYTLSFRARSRRGTLPLRAGFNQNQEPWQSLKSLIFAVSNEWKEYSIQYTMDQDPDILTRIEFDLGAKRGTIYFEWIQLRES